MLDFSLLFFGKETPNSLIGSGFSDSFLEYCFSFSPSNNFSSGSFVMVIVTVFFQCVLCLDWKFGTWAIDLLTNFAVSCNDLMN